MVLVDKEHSPEINVNIHKIIDEFIAADTFVNSFQKDFRIMCHHHQ